MPVYLIVDLVLVCIAVGIVIRSWGRGFVSSVVRLVGTVAAYAGAWLVSGPLAGMLYKNVAEERLVRYAATLVPPDLETLVSGFQGVGGNAQMLEALGLGDISGAISGYIETTLAELGLDNMPLGLFDSTEVSAGLTRRVLDEGSSVAQAITDVLFQPAVTTILRVAVFAVIFALLSAVVSVLYRVGFGFNHLPLLGGFNHLLGAGVGLLEAGIVLYILCIILVIVSAFFGAKVEWLAWDALQKSRFIDAFIQFKPPAGLGIL